MRQRVCVEIRKKSRIALFLEFFFFTLFIAVIALIFAPVAGCSSCQWPPSDT